jgi:hypothetical protein
MEKECLSTQSDMLGVISGAISYWHAPPLYRVGNKLHSISWRFKVVLSGLPIPILANLFTRGNGLSHSIHKAKEAGPQNIKGVNYEGLVLGIK